MTQPGDDTLVDPIGTVVAVVTAVDATLDQDTVRQVVEQSSGGRAKRRRLAAALAGDTSVLTSGRSPAPTAVGDLLLALRAAGATGVSPPRCATCGRELASMQRHGQDWYCSVCVRQLSLRPCASCGQQRPVASRDRAGQPRCDRCPDGDERDPRIVLATIIARLDSSLAADTAADAARRVVRRQGNLRRLAWAVQDRPGLLTGDGAQAPTSAVLRLIDELCAAGAEEIIRPACPQCQRIVRLHRRLQGQWGCRNCVAKANAVPCSRCGAVREPAARDARGEPLCPTAWSVTRSTSRSASAAGVGNGSTRALWRADPRGLPSPQARILQCVWANRALHGVQDHRAAVVRRVRSLLGGVLTLRTAGRRPRRHTAGTVVRRLRGAGPGLLEDLPDLRRQRTSHRWSLPPLPPPPAAPRAPRRHQRPDPPPTAGPAPNAGHRRPASHRVELAQAPHRQVGARRPGHRTAPAQPRRPRRSTTQQAGRASAERPGGHRSATSPRRAARTDPTVGHPDRQPAQRPRRQTVAAPLRGLARAATAPATQPRRPNHLRSARYGPPTGARRHRSARLAAQPRAHPCHLPPSRPRRLADQHRRQPPGRSRPLRPLGDLPASQPQPAVCCHPMDRPGPGIGPARALAASQTAPARRRPRRRRPCRRAAAPALRPTSRGDQSAHGRRRRHQRRHGEAAPGFHTGCAARPPGNPHPRPGRYPARPRRPW